MAQPPQHSNRTRRPVAAGGCARTAELAALPLTGAQRSSRPMQQSTHQRSCSCPGSAGRPLYSTSSPWQELRATSSTRDGKCADKRRQQPMRTRRLPSTGVSEKTVNGFTFYGGFCPLNTSRQSVAIKCNTTTLKLRKLAVNRDLQPHAFNESTQPSNRSAGLSFTRASATSSTSSDRPINESCLADRVHGDHRSTRWMARHGLITFLSPCSPLFRQRTLVVLRALPRQEELQLARFTPDRVRLLRRYHLLQVIHPPARVDVDGEHFPHHADDDANKGHHISLRAPTLERRVLF
ncbi:hypothetical protein ON010_g737 [Phytophthora cinnamomi]|nr:hypothetical protein ON010_g737 [Phytophthora cinnamomi]